MNSKRCYEYVSCLRKRRHIDYLSALRHAATLDRKSTVVVYPCDYCGGLHVGHQTRTSERKARRKRNSVPENPLLRRLDKAKRKIEKNIKSWETGVINPRPVTVKKFQQSLTNLREHLAFLESQVAGEGSVNEHEVNRTPATNASGGCR